MSSQVVGKRSFRSAVVVSLCMVVASGCALRESYRVNRLLEEREVSRGILGNEIVDPLDLSTLCLPEDQEATGGSCSAGPSAARPPASKRRSSACIMSCRSGALTAYVRAINDQKAFDRLFAILVQRSDRICEVHKSDIVASSSILNTALGLAVTGLSGAGTVVAGAAVKAAVAAATTATSGSKSLINEEVYQKLFVGTIVSAIDTSRNEMLATIANHRKENVEYTVDDMVRDVQEYHQRCSFYNGLVVLSEKIEDARKASAIDKGDVVVGAATQRKDNNSDNESKSKDKVTNKDKLKTKHAEAGANH